jgi:toxin YhaV
MASRQWTAYLFRNFLRLYLRLARDVELLKKEDPDHYANRFKPKLLKRIHDNITNVSDDPSRKEYRLGKTLGKEYTGWRRVKMFERYRLFFRFFDSFGEIFFAWLNDESTLREKGGASDVYKVFRAMLDRGEIPNHRQALLSESKPYSDEFANRPAHRQ